MNKIFFDANILLDILMPNRPNHTKAIEVYTAACEQYDALATSENILTTIEYIASKNGTDCEVVWKFFNSLQQNFELYTFSEILEESLNLYHDACKKGEKLDFEDLLQLESAIKNKCHVFLTEDKAISKLDVNIKVLNLNSFR